MCDGVILKQEFDVLFSNIAQTNFAWIRAKLFSQRFLIRNLKDTVHSRMFQM